MRPLTTLVALTAALAAPDAASAQMPPPEERSCTFPEDSVLCEDPVTVEVVLVGADGRPVENAFVRVDVVALEGTLRLNQETVGVARTGASGRAAVAFSDGIRGDALVRFEVFAEGVPLCTSEPYPVLCSAPLEPRTWGFLKRRFLEF